MSTQNNNGGGGFVIFSGSKVWYTPNPTTVSVPKQKVKVTRTRASAKGQVHIVNSIFQKPYEITTDIFWKNMFKNMMGGTFFRGFRYANNCLTYRVKTKITEQKLSEEDPPEITCSQIKEFMKIMAGVFSPDDIEKQKKEEEYKISQETLNQITAWSEIHSHERKSLLISFFVQTVVKNCGLNDSERIELDTLIRSGIMAGYFNSENIKIVGNIIVSINGLEKNSNNGIFYINKTLCKVKFKKSESKTSKELASDNTSNLQKDDDCSFIKKWTKFLDKLDKRCGKY